MACHSFEEFFGSETDPTIHIATHLVLPVEMASYTNVPVALKWYFITPAQYCTSAIGLY